MGIRQTWKIPSTARMCDKNAFPNPSPALAPRTSPAMSLISRKAEICADPNPGLPGQQYSFPALHTRISTSLLGLKHSVNQLKRSSGTFTRASFGLMVQKGKFSAGMASFVSVLKRVDLPTLGNPTCRAVSIRERPVNSQCELLQTAAPIVPPLAL